MAGERLKVTEGKAAGSEIVLGEVLLIGRAARDEGALEGDSELSREHARLRRDAGALVIEDLGSTNGTFVNGRRIDVPTPIRSGDKIEVGSTKLEVAGGAEPTAVVDRPVTPPVQPTSIADRPPGPPPGAPPGGPPPGAPLGGPPPGVGGPPAGGPPGGPPAGGPPPEMLAMIKAKMRKTMIVTAGVAFVVGFAVAALIFAVL